MMELGSTCQQSLLQNCCFLCAPASQLYQNGIWRYLCDDVWRMLMQHGQLCSERVVLLKLCDLHRCG